MRLSDWIKNIRWKYFTNEKAGLIFKELMKEFEMVNKMTENKRYHYHDFEEYCTITDTNIYPKDLNDFYNELVQEGYLEDYDGDKEVVLELAEEKYQEYLEDHCMSTKEIINLINQQEELIKKHQEKFNKIIKIYDEAKTKHKQKISFGIRGTKDMARHADLLFKYLKCIHKTIWTDVKLGERFEFYQHNLTGDCYIRDTQYALCVLRFENPKQAKEWIEYLNNKTYEELK